MTPIASVKVKTPPPEKAEYESASPPKAETPKTALVLSEKLNSQRPKPANGNRSARNNENEVEVETKTKEDSAKEFAATLTHNPKANVFVATGFVLVELYF